MCYDGNILTDIIECYYRQDALSTYFNVSDLWDFAVSDDEEVRMWLAKALAFEQSNLQTVGLLSMLSLDADAMVRVEAVDSISNFPWPQSYAIVKNALDDNEELVRAYAVYGTASLGNKLNPNDARKSLQSLLLTETSLRVKVDIFEGLYILGDQSALSHLIECYKCDNHHIKCAVLNALENQLNKENVNQIRGFLRNCIIENESISVTTIISKLLAECCQLNRNS